MGQAPGTLDPTWPTMQVFLLDPPCQVNVNIFQTPCPQLVTQSLTQQNTGLFKTVRHFFKSVTMIGP